MSAKYRAAACRAVRCRSGRAPAHPAEAVLTTVCWPTEYRQVREVPPHRLSCRIVQLRTGAR